MNKVTHCEQRKQDRFEVWVAALCLSESVISVAPNHIELSRDTLHTQQLPWLFNLLNPNSWKRLPPEQGPQRELTVCDTAAKSELQWEKFGMDYENEAWVREYTATWNHSHTVTHSVFPSRSFLPSLKHTEHTHKNTSPQWSHVPQWCLQGTPVWIRVHLVPLGITWEMRRGGWRSLGVEDCVCLSLPLRVVAAAVLLTAWVGKVSSATTHLFKSTRKEVTCNTSESGMKGVMSLYGNARLLRGKVTPWCRQRGF